MPFSGPTDSVYRGASGYVELDVGTGVCVWGAGMGCGGVCGVGGVERSGAPPWLRGRVPPWLCSHPSSPPLARAPPPPATAGAAVAITSNQWSDVVVWSPWTAMPDCYRNFGGWGWWACCWAGLLCCCCCRWCWEEVPLLSLLLLLLLLLLLGTGVAAWAVGLQWLARQASVRACACRPLPSCLLTPATLHLVARPLPPLASLCGECAVQQAGGATAWGVLAQVGLGFRAWGLGFRWADPRGWGGHEGLLPAREGVGSGRPALTLSCGPVGRWSPSGPP